MLPLDQIAHAPEDRVATAAMSHLWGSMGAGVMAGVILVSTFGCLNGMILAGARVFYAMAKDGLFFARFASVHPRFHTPIVSLVGQGLCASLLTLTGSYGQLLDYILCTTLLFYLLTVAGLFRLARQHPEAGLLQRPWDAVIPVAYLLGILYIAVNLAIYKPQYTLPGLGIVSLGLPIYLCWRTWHNRR
jgi:APA family basic amino acid/polyamine antiporter